MDLHLAPAEAGFLKKVLHSYLSDLRAEIGKTENYDFRQSLKEDEAQINALLVRLDAPGS